MPAEMESTPVGKEAMNIVVLSQYFWPESFRINNLVTDLQRRGMRVDVVTGQPNYPGGTVLPGYRAGGFGSGVENGVNVHRLPLLPRGRGGALRLTLNYLSFVLSGIVLAPFALRKKPVDVIFVYAISPILQAIPAIVLKWIKGAKVVIWVQDLWPESLEATGYVKNKAVLALVRAVVRWIYARADLILVQSHAFTAPVATLADPAKIAYYPNSADACFGTRTPEHEVDMAVLDSGFPVVFAGNLGAAQALETIVGAAALLADEPEIRLVLVGSGSRAAWLTGEVARLGLKNVSMPGQFPVSAMPSILGRAGALLVTLNADPIFARTIPSKLQAYLAVGRPIIASLNGEGARIIDEAGAGLCCPAQDARALADAIVALHRMAPQERAAMGRRGTRYFAEHFDSDLLADRLLDKFSRLLGRDKTIFHQQVMPGERKS